MKQFIYPYIMLENSFDAANYYKGIFNGEITYIMWGKDWPDCPEDQLENVMHLQLKVNNNQIYFADQKLPTEGNIHIHLDYQELDELKKVFKKMSIGNNVIQDLKETFWGAMFGSIKDRFGITWQFHYSIPKEK